VARSFAITDPLTGPTIDRGFFSVAGISGSNGREKRPGLDGLLKDATARKINMIAAWSVDRLGRSLQHLVGFLNELQALNCQLYLHQQAIEHDHPIGPGDVSDVWRLRRVRARDDR
jgi:DNA invertase Pin-like site-specific DNA recombinase